MTVCVVTGGIGSGKSTVCSMMNRLYGCPVYVADDRAKELYLSHPSLLEDIEKRLVMNLRDSEGGFLPSLLAQRIFAEPEALKSVESLLFPVLMEDFNSWKSGFRDTHSLLINNQHRNGLGRSGKLCILLFFFLLSLFAKKI